MKKEVIMSDTTLYGFDGSTYVRTVRCVLARKGIAYDQVPVNVLTGEPREPEHLARHPFGKVPVLDIDGMRLRETDAIVRYLDARTPEPAMFPADARARAKADENVALINNYGYGAIIGFVAYHLFPDLVGGKDDEARKTNLESARTLAKLVIENKGDAAFIAGAEPGYGDYLLGPLVAYATMTEDGPALLSVDGMQVWWDRLSADETFQATAPDLG
jgi:glutathione S-transferase